MWDYGAAGWICRQQGRSQINSRAKVFEQFHRHTWTNAVFFLHHKPGAANAPQETNLAVPENPRMAGERLNVKEGGGPGSRVRSVQEYRRGNIVVTCERCSQRQLRAVLDKLHPNGSGDTGSSRTPRSRQKTKDRIAELFLRGETQGDAPGSKWAEVNAIIEYGDWIRPLRSNGQRFARALDDGAEKTRALQLVAAA